MVVLALYGLTAVATATTSSKPYSVALSITTLNGAAENTVAAGSTNEYSFAITNHATTQSIGSAEFVPPNAFTINAASVTFTPPEAATPTVTNGNSNCPTDQVSPVPSPLTCLIVNNLSIGPGSTETITLDAATSCAAAPNNSYGLQVQQNNQFNGKPGNQLGPETGALNVTVSGSCTLEFVTGNEPADANPSTTISNESYTTIPPAGPIEVEALDGMGNTVSGVPVTVAIDLNTSPDPGKSAQLAGTPVTPTDNNGIASFDTANIAQPGEYVLQATSPGFAPADSSLSGFLIGSGAACPANTTCSANTNDPKNGQKDNLTATTSTNGTITVIVGLDTSSFCTTNDGMSHAPDVTTTSATGLTATNTKFGKELNITFASKLGPGHYAVCWSDGVQLVDPVPACGKLTQPVTSACLLSPISKDNTTGLINEDVLLPIGDGNHTW